MSQEILYTSAPAGLKPGSQGFSTVVSTSGMAKNLAEQLEGLSGYRHVFAPHDPHAAHNPVVNMHVKLTVGGRPFHVLSRICDAGIDYTQRTNKFAHHLALETAELSPAGPAAVLAAPGFMQATWDGQPRLLAAGRTLPQLAATPTVCHAWQQVTGDAGWGGVLAETLGPAVGATIKRQAVLIFRPGIDCLPLLAEALSLVPPSERWGVTFSTYFTKLPPGIECRWRCVLEGSPEAAQVQRSAAVLVLDLCRAMPAASGGPLVDGARTGRVSWPKPVAAPKPMPMQPSAPAMAAVGAASVDELEQALAEENSASLLPEPMAGVAGESGEPYGVRPPPRKRELPESPMTVKKASRPKWLWAVGGAVAAVMVIGIALFAIARSPSPREPEKQVVSATQVPLVSDPAKTQPPGEIPKAADPKKVEPLEKEKEKEKEKAPHEIEGGSDKGASTDDSKKRANADSGVAPEDPNAKVPTRVPAFRYVRDIPRSARMSPVKGDRSNEIQTGIPLARIPENSNIGISILPPRNQELVIYNAANGWAIGRSKSSPAWANIFIENGDLTFHWSDASSSLYERLVRNSRIVISGDVEGTIALRSPIPSKGLKVTSAVSMLAKYSDLAVEATDIEDCHVHFELPLNSTSNYRIVSNRQDEIIVSDIKGDCKIKFSKDIENGSIRVKIEFTVSDRLKEPRWRRMAETYVAFNEMSVQLHHKVYTDLEAKVTSRRERIINSDPKLSSPENQRLVASIDEEKLKLRRERESLDDVGLCWKSVLENLNYRITLLVGEGKESIELVAPEPVAPASVATPLPQGPANGASQ